MIKEARIVGLVCLVGFSMALVGSNGGHRLVEWIGLAIAVAGMALGVATFRAARRR